MKRTSITILFTLAIIVLLTLLFMNYKDSTPDSNKNDDAAAVEDHTTTENSSYAGIHIVTDIHDEPLYHMAVHYPEFENESLNETINNYITRAKQDFLDEVDSNKQFLKEYLAELNISFDIYPVADHVYSIVLSNSSYVAGANGSQSSKVLIVDTDEGRYIPQQEIIKDTQENRDTIYTLLSREFEQSEEYRDMFFKEYLKQWIEDEHNTFSNVYLNKQSLVFKFDKYEVTAGAAGSPEITFPIDKVKTLFTEEWIKKLEIKLDKPTEQPATPSPVPSETDEPDKEVPPNKKRVALTFDDGPHPANTVSILNLLEKYDAKATFFMLGNRVDFYPETAKKVAEQGHEIGNHTWDHKDLTTLERADIAEEINRTTAAIKQAIGKEPTVFRPPYGAINDQVKNTAELPIVLWTIDTLDWKSHDPKEVLKIVKSNVKDGSIILMHDIHKTTVEAVTLVLKYLQDEGYEFVTVSELKNN